MWFSHWQWRIWEHLRETNLYHMFNTRVLYPWTTPRKMRNKFQWGGGMTTSLPSNLSLVKYSINGERRRKNNTYLETLHSDSDVLETVRIGRLRWAEHAWRNQNTLIRAVREQNTVDKKPLGIQQIRWKDVLKKDVKRLGEGS